jgi:NodT family efflux transporter outer membrane factor (OMF) lipoprotein
MSGRMTGFGRTWLTAGAALLVTGCTVGPNFHAPAAPTETRYDRDGTGTIAAPAGLAGGAQQWVAGAPQDGWWHAFGSAQLDTLIDEALKANTDLAAANAALKVAHENWLATRGVLYPTVDASLGTSRNRSSQYLSPVLNSPNFTYSLQTAQVSVGYQLDLFGLNRRTVEQARAQYDVQAYQTAAARISLINNVAAAAFNEASLRAQMGVQDRLIAIQRETLDILHRQQNAGQAAGADVLAQQAALAQSEAALPPLRRAHAQAVDLIAYLTGRSARCDRARCDRAAARPAAVAAVGTGPPASRYPRRRGRAACRQRRRRHRHRQSPAASDAVGQRRGQFGRLVEHPVGGQHVLVGRRGGDPADLCRRHFAAQATRGARRL